MIDYQKILDQNLLNVFKDILKEIKKNGVSNGNQLYVTFISSHKNVKIPNWLIEKYPEEMTIVIQHEYYNLEINKEYFTINLSFNDIMANLEIGFDSIISFADPFANFGLKFNKTDKIISRKIKNLKVRNKDNVINFSNYKKINLDNND